MDGVHMTPIILGIDLWILDEDVAYPPLITNSDVTSTTYGQPFPGRASNLKSIIKAGTRIYLKPPECRCQCQNNPTAGRNKKKVSSDASGRTVRSKK